MKALDFKSSDEYQLFEMAAYLRCSTIHDYPDTKRIDEFYIELNIHDQESNYQKLFFKMAACFRCSTTHDFIDKVAVWILHIIH